MPQARWFFQQLIIGLDYCHKVGFTALNCRCCILGPQFHELELPNWNHSYERHIHWKLSPCNTCRWGCTIETSSWRILSWILRGGPCSKFAILGTASMKKTACQSQKLARQGTLVSQHCSCQDYTAYGSKDLLFDQAFQCPAPLMTTNAMISMI